MTTLRDAREWERAQEFACVEMECLRLQAILAEPDLHAAERPYWERQLAAQECHLEALDRVVRPLPARETVNEWLIPPDVIDRIWAAVEARPDLIAELLTRFLVPDLTWAPGARQAKADCPFCRDFGSGHGKQNFEVELSSSKWSCWCCPDKSGNLRTALRAYSGLRFRDLMKELGAYVGIVIEDPAPRKWVEL